MKALIALLIAFAPLHTGEEDQPGWDCRYQGNQTCGIGNPQGVTPGYYGDCWPGYTFCPTYPDPTIEER